MLKAFRDRTPLHLNLYDIKYLHLSEFPLERIEKILNQKESRIKRFNLPKRNSDDFREIEYPIGDYKKLLKLLHNVLMRRAKFPPSVCGGIIDKNLFEMVKCHCGKEAIYQIDIKDFFPNITDKTVQKFFIESGCTESVAHLLSEIATLNGYLPQGFPTSPIISNLVLWQLDIEQENICKKYSLARTRWIDDIIVSGRIENLERAVSKIDTSIKYHGFKINIKKKKFMRRIDKKKDIVVVGLDIKKNKPEVPLLIFEKIENILYACIQLGRKDAYEIYKEEFKSKDIQQSLRGKINFVAEYNKKKGQYLLELYNNISW